MAEEENQNGLGEYDDQGAGFSYRLAGDMGTSTPSQKLFRVFKAPHTIMLLILMGLLVGVFSLQVVQLIQHQQPASCANQQSLESQQNDSNRLLKVYNTTTIAAQKLSGIIHTLSYLESSSRTTKGAVDDILLVAEELLQLQNKSLIFSSHVPVSCQDIKKFEPDSPSGYYHINSQLVYCEMGQLCGSSDGWTRVGYLDMADQTTNCPTGFRYWSGQGVRGCGRPWSPDPSCVSTKLQSNGISYSEVCGKVIGYQKGSPDAVDTRFIDQSIHNDIDQYYVDGVSITYGSSPRKHIWTFMAGVFESYADDGDCPCNDPPSGTQQVQSFIGKDYFCESGNPTNTIKSSVFTVDPLWDGKGCGQNELGCCKASFGLPWFHKMLNASTAEPIEVRECGDQAVGDEDVLINFYDIYVK